MSSLESGAKQGHNLEHVYVRIDRCHYRHHALILIFSCCQAQENANQGKRELEIIANGRDPGLE